MTKPDITSPQRRGVSRAQREFARLTRPSKDPDLGTHSFPALTYLREDLLQRLRWLSPGAGPLLREELAYLSALIDLINAELAALKGADVQYWGGLPGHRARILKCARTRTPRDPEILRLLVAQLRELGEDAVADEVAALLIGPAR